MIVTQTGAVFVDHIEAIFAKNVFLQASQECLFNFALHHGV